MSGWVRAARRGRPVPRPLLLSSGDMTEARTSVYRSAAYERYLHAQEETVLPRVVRPRSFRFLWGAIALVALAGLAAWATPVPVFARGVATVAQATIFLVLLRVPTQSIEILHLAVTGVRICL